MTDTVPARKPPPMSQEAWDKLPEDYKPVFAAAYSSKSDLFLGQLAENYLGFGGTIQCQNP